MAARKKVTKSAKSDTAVHVIQVRTTRTKTARTKLDQSKLVQSAPARSKPVWSEPNGVRTQALEAKTTEVKTTETAKPAPESARSTAKAARSATKALSATPVKIAVGKQEKPVVGKQEKLIVGKQEKLVVGETETSARKPVVASQAAEVAPVLGKAAALKADSSGAMKVIESETARKAQSVHKVAAPHKVELALKPETDVRKVKAKILADGQSIADAQASGQASGPVKASTVASAPEKKLDSPTSASAQPVQVSAVGVGTPGPTKIAAIAPAAAAPKAVVSAAVVASTTAPAAVAAIPVKAVKPAPVVKTNERETSGGDQKTMKNSVSRHGFKLSEFVVYPAHGVGQIVAVEEQEVAGFKLELFVINFAKDKMTLRVPVGKVVGVGMRKLSDPEQARRSLEILTGRARVKRTMWSRRAQEYEAKINSGDINAIAEVVRDLFRSEAQPEQSYSERQLYEAALDRMMREIAAVQKISEPEALKVIDVQLRKNTKRGVKPEGAEPGEGEEVGIEEAA